MCIIVTGQKPDFDRGKMKRKSHLDQRHFGCYFESYIHFSRRFFKRWKLSLEIQFFKSIAFHYQVFKLHLKDDIFR